MGNLQVKKVPDALHDRMRERAAAEGCTLSDFVLRSIERELSRGEWLQRLRQRPAIDLGVRASELVEEERSTRDGELP